MKKHILHTSSLILLIFSHHITANNDIPEQNIEQWLPTIYTTTWTSTIAIEALSLAFIPINHALYGNNAIAESSAKMIKNLIESVNLQSPLDIKSARTLWTSLGENVFSHQKTLFVNPTIFNQPDLVLTDNLKKEIIASAVAINNNYDAKILAAAIAIPLVVWATAHYTDKIMQKLNEAEYKASWIEIIEQYKNSFYLKTGISLSILAGYILYQRHLIANITKTLLAS